MTIATENLPDDIAALKQIIADLSRDAVVAQTEIARLKFQLARYRRAEFGQSSEKLARSAGRGGGRSAKTGTPATARASAA